MNAGSGISSQLRYSPVVPVATQVQTILTTTLEQLPWKVFEPAAVELVARTVSGTSGDLRQAFKVSITGRLAAGFVHVPLHSGFWHLSLSKDCFPKRPTVATMHALNV